MKRSKGFTLVELLVVMVVIAILAVIGVVAYNGVVDRANDAKKVADITMIKRQLDAYIVKHGTLPVGSGDVSMVDKNQYTYLDTFSSQPQCAAAAMRNDFFTNFTGCVPMLHGDVWGYRSMQYWDYMNEHGIQRSLTASVAEVRYQQKDSNSHRRWRELFMQLPDLANVVPPADNTAYDIKLILQTDWHGRGKYCYYISARTRFVGEVQNNWSSMRRSRQLSCTPEFQMPFS